ncbi:CRE-ART-1 protein [Planoprotostelium fungivorum]|uniref:CRE-ART-1 protein n=1 Tax=Planoprotostelium fungivorum TaxID=1890364 RepID=A0A2P6MW61_9EUKA|nr:CRE-ART-1 protein [Planoprotostelium fungivorum]
MMEDETPDIEHRSPTPRSEPDDEPAISVSTPMEDMRPAALRNMNAAIHHVGSGTFTPPPETLALASTSANIVQLKAEDRRFITLQDLYGDLRNKVGVELRKVAATDPPKKKDNNRPLGPEPAVKPKKKKKKTFFEPVSGIKSKNATTGSSINADIQRLSVLLSGWGASNAIDATDKDGNTALMLASEKGRVDIVNYLIAKGADVQLRDNWGKTAVHKGAARGQWDTVNVLLNNGCSVNSKDNFGNTPLHAAIRNGHKVVSLQHGADVYAKNNRDELPLEKSKTAELKHYIEMALSKGKTKKSTDASEQATSSRSKTKKPPSSAPTTWSDDVSTTSVSTTGEAPEKPEKPPSPTRSRPAVKTLPPPKVSKEDERAKRMQVMKTLIKNTDDQKKKRAEEEEIERRNKVEEAKAKKLESLRLKREEEDRLREEKTVKAAEEQKNRQEAWNNQQINFALHIATWCSAVHDPMETGQCGPDKSVDGDPNSRFCGHPPDQAVLGFDLGASRRINKMRIRFERAFAREYEIDVGLMGDYNETETKPKDSVWSNEHIDSLNIQWRTVVHHTDGKEGWIEHVFDDEIDCRFIRIKELKAAVDGWGMSVWEVEALGKQGQLGEPATVLFPPIQQHGGEDKRSQSSRPTSRGSDMANLTLPPIDSRPAKNRTSEALGVTGNFGLRGGTPQKLSSDHTDEDMIEVTIESRSRKSLAVLSLDENTTVRQLKIAFNTVQQRFTTEQGAPLGDDGAILSSLGFKDGQKVTLTFKDLGPQIGWQTVFLIEYAGPIFIYFFFFLRPSFIYSEAPTTTLQKIAFVAWIFHFVKREFETLFVHRFSSETMPLSNLWKNCMYYWSFALVNGFLINRSGFGENSGFLSILLPLLIFIAAEAGNGVTHLQLRNLRPAGTRKRGIPRGGLFNYVTCPNYTCEILSWIAFSLMTGSIGSWLFTLVGAGQMFLWAKTKHLRYRKEFADYPKSRKILVPFVL